MTGHPRALNSVRGVNHFCGCNWAGRQSGSCLEAGDRDKSVYKRSSEWDKIPEAQVSCVSKFGGGVISQ